MIPFNLSIFGHPLFSLVLIALTLAVIIAVWICGRRDHSRLLRKIQRQETGRGDSEKFLMKQIAALRERVIELEERSSLLVQPPPARSGLNLAKRTQALRMVRRGDCPEQVAAALAIPQNEAKLLQRVHKATL